jgi:hypothetical protein
MSETANHSGPFKQSLSDIGDNGIDFNFIRKHEGYSEKMYVPVCTEKSVQNTKNNVCFGKPAGSVIGRSGVTIGAGFDLGQHSEMDLKRMEIPEHLIRKLKPFLGKKKDSAVEALEDELNYVNPLTWDDIRQIDTAVKVYYAKKLSGKFASQTGKPFSTLPGKAQTAIFSLFYQYGLGKSEKGEFKKIWENLKNGDYQKAADSLESMTSYRNRRKDEASLLRGINADNK